MELLLVVLKENFCSNKIVRVNPGGRVRDPPPVISRVKIVLGCCYFGVVSVCAKFQLSSWSRSG